MPTIRLYHGTAKSFSVFDPRYARLESEPNAALGVHLTEQPAIAAEYAELSMKDARAGRARVLVVDVDVTKVGIVSTREDYLGRARDDIYETIKQPSDFVEVRLELTGRGFDAVAGDELGGDLCGCWAVFDAARITIVGEIKVDEAYDLDPARLPDYESELVSLFPYGDVADLEDDEPEQAGMTL